MTLPPPGWFPNPDPGGAGLRWWDGEQWTGHYHLEPGAQNVPDTADPGAALPDRPAVTASSVVSSKVAEVRELGLASFIGASARRRFVATPRQKAPAGRRPPSVQEVLAQVTIEAPRYPLDEQIEVAGEHFRAKEIRRIFAESGMTVTSRGATLENLQAVLMPEPWNPHDPNAVAVLIGPNCVGYLPAEQAPDYAVSLGLLAQRGVLTSGVARLWAQTDTTGVLRARCTILIPEPDAF